MPTTTLLAAGAVSIGVGLSFAAISRAIQRMTATGSGAWALGGYAAWWACLAVYLIGQGAITLLAGFDALDPRLHLAWRLFAVPLLCLGVWGLTSFLLFLYTGRREVFAWVGIFYALVAGLFYAATLAPDQGTRIERWLVAVDDSTPLYRLVYLLVGLPPILASMAFLALLRRAPDRTRRYRIGLVAGSILAYIGGGLAARLWAGDVAIFVTLVLFGIVAAVAGLMAYYPPAAVRAWLGKGTPSSAEGP